jgi:hypothetical protein
MDTDTMRTRARSAPSLSCTSAKIRVIGGQIAVQLV